MDELHPCPHCNRHVRASDDACPFCATPAAPVAPRSRVRTGRFTRAVVFSGALIGAAALAGCGDDDPAPADATPTADGSAAVDAGAPDAADDPADASTQPDAFIPMPYGAPPAAGRLV